MHDMNGLMSHQLAPLALVCAGGDFCASVAPGPHSLNPSWHLTNPEREGTAFKVDVGTRKERSYGFEYKRSLSEPAWIRLPPVTGVDGVTTLTDPTATDPQRFYRVHEE